MTDDPKLFKSDFDWWNNACLNYQIDHLDSYIRGYKQASDLLVEHIKETRRDQDILVYPIVFLYRQSLELQLKQIIRDGFQLLNVNQSFPTHHKLDELWKQCKGILKKVWSDQMKELNEIESCINQFSEIDPGSFSFRYPTNKDGSTALPNIRHINLRNLAEIMKNISSLLEGVSIEISVYLEHKIEMELEYRKYYGENEY